jgi:hypothetical protein
LDHRVITLPNARSLRSPLKTASLILVDRWEDLFSPISVFGGSQSVAHRIVNTCEIAKSRGITEEEGGVTKKLDLSLQPGWLQSLNLYHSGVTSNASISPLLQPMSAVSSSSFKTVPSLCYSASKGNHSSANDIIRFKLMACSEEEGRTYICEELKKQIILSNGTLPPPKKRGFGAEMSALIQSLIESSGVEDTKSSISKFRTSYNPIICCRNERLIALSYAVIDSMQRSSAKQFNAVCTWKTSFDDRSGRENELLANLYSFDDFDVAFAGILKHFMKKKDSSSSFVETTKIVNDAGTSKAPMKAIKAKSAKSSVKEKEIEEKVEPVDVVHLLVLCVG